MTDPTRSDQENPERIESDTRREPAMGDPGDLPVDQDRAEAISPSEAEKRRFSSSEDHEDRAGRAGTPDRARESGLRDQDTRRPTGMGEPGTLPSERGPMAKARHAAGGRLEEAAGRVRQLGDETAARSAFLKPTRPLAYGAAERIDGAADYVRTTELDEMRSDLETTVRRHPLASVAVAFFAGYTLRRIF